MSNTSPPENPEDGPDDGARLPDKDARHPDSVEKKRSLLPYGVVFILIVLAFVVFLSARANNDSDKPADTSIEVNIDVHEQDSDTTLPTTSAPEMPTTADITEAPNTTGVPDTTEAPDATTTTDSDATTTTRWDEEY